MTPIDWLIVGLPLVGIGATAVVLQRHMRSVADFMAASRLAGRYLLLDARGEMGMTVVGAVAMFEVFQKSGFTLSWWGKLNLPVSLIIVLWGVVIYRYRETRALTQAQFFEVRYCKSFRVFVGFLAFLSGMINYGIFPAVASRFFIYCCGLPVTLSLGSFAIPTTAIVMLVYMAFSLTLTMTGGHLTIMVTDCVSCLISMLFYTVVTVVLLRMFHWSQIYEVMSLAPSGESLLNPFDTGRMQDFNIWYVLIGLFGHIYSIGTWQGGHAFSSCALNAHEARMSGVLGKWFGHGKGLMFALIPICAYTFLHHPDFAAGAARVHEVLKAVPDEHLRGQVTTAATLGEMLPLGIKGMVVSIFLLGLIACDGSYVHSWGSIFIQDVVLPFRKTPFSPRLHLWLLRFAVLGVAAFGFAFSQLYHQTQYVVMYFALTGAIYTGGAGAVLMGGLYWKKGTTAGAWCAMLTGSLISVVGLLAQQPVVWNGLHDVLQGWNSDASAGWLTDLLADWPTKCPINGMWMSLIAMVSAIALYVGVSMLTCRESFNMDRMLHRGQYAMKSQEGMPSVRSPSRSMLEKLIGVDENFTRGDRIIAWSLFAWLMLWFTIFVVVTLWNVMRPWPLEWWGVYWHYEIIILPLLVMSVTTVWFWLGGVRDLVRLFRLLKTVKRNDLDDGMVVRHRNLDEIEGTPEPSRSAHEAGVSNG